MRGGCECPDCDNPGCRSGGCQGRKPGHTTEYQHGTSEPVRWRPQAPRLPQGRTEGSQEVYTLRLPRVAVGTPTDYTRRWIYPEPGDAAAFDAEWREQL